MIIFYNKKTGRIVGTIDGRIHGDEDFKMWIGSKEENDRLVIIWKKNEEGIFEPDVSDKKLKNTLVKLDKKVISIYDFTVDLNKKTIVEKKGVKDE